MSTWNDDQLDKLCDRTDAGFKEVKGEIKDLRKEMHDGFEKVDQKFEKVDQKFEKVDGEFKSVRQEMKEGFAQTATREEMNERFSELHRLANTLIAVGGAVILAIVGHGILA